MHQKLCCWAQLLRSIRNLTRKPCTSRQTKNKKLEIPSSASIHRVKLVGTITQFSTATCALIRQ
jgi:hypothetical protein